MNKRKLDSQPTTLAVYIGYGSEYSSHEYDIDIVGSETVTLKRSLTSMWTKPGEEVAVCKELGSEDYEITISNKKKIKLNPAEILELYVLLGMVGDINTANIEYKKFETVKKVGQ